ncbi:aspartate carbamoyltransferase regulatory subunit [Leptotrichia sp. OH3620_COT-345]|uniref:aspartate carbamoyltransferase regulatory subunit n=1 Tax=Leptotrichia sp. OH3620_COT-345 TaxID=2491048 RepID=UPI000F6451DC|nr:aspartate carbamoyltransferase regulatory subunit [Leptotrichia sp. OH3620_COT-345]RRD39008.1 aspartate carbamoyltransferase regulatory subunit [Leptotrichia sp. OH3620_COT-345]
MELQITALKNGIVIDHIPIEKTFPIVEILHLREYGEIVTVACNLKSSSLGKKGLIKIEDRSLGENELGEIAILAPDVTINIIENFKVVKKIKLAIPNEITGLIKCNNNKCISNHEEIESKFIKIVDEDKIKYKCFYCERVIAENEIELKPL